MNPADLVERLRAVNQDVTQPWKLCEEAADEINRLRRENQTMKTVDDALEASHQQFRLDNDREWRAKLDHTKAEIERLKARYAYDPTSQPFDEPFRHVGPDAPAAPRHEEISMTEELIERLKRHALGSADEDTMRRWDGIRAYFKEGDRGASHPRDCFESIIDCYAEDCAAAADEIERLQAKLSKAVEALKAIKRGGFDGSSTWLRGIARATLKEIGGDDA